jgi:hypothetical protein
MMDFAAAQLSRPNIREPVDRAWFTVKAPPSTS